MPLVNVRTVKGLLNAQQKEQLQLRLTDLMVEIEGRGNAQFRPYVWVLIEELDASNWMLGGLHPTAANAANIQG